MKEIWSHRHFFSWHIHEGHVSRMKAEYDWGFKSEFVLDGVPVRQKSEKPPSYYDGDRVIAVGWFHGDELEAHYVIDPLRRKLIYTKGYSWPLSLPFTLLAFAVVAALFWPTLGILLALLTVAAMFYAFPMVQGEFMARRAFKAACERYAPRNLD